MSPGVVSVSEQRWPVQELVECRQWVRRERAPGCTRGCSLQEHSTARQGVPDLAEFQRFVDMSSSLDHRSSVAGLWQLSAHTIQAPSFH